MSKVAVYLRCSTENQDTDMQLDCIRNWCKSQGIVDYDVYEDYFTGRSTSRPELQRLRDNAAKYDRLVVYKFDRLSRSMRDFLNLMHEFDDAGIAVISIKDQVDLSTVMGRAMMKMMMIVSELEVEFLRGRVRDGLSAARSRGVRLGAPPEYDHERIISMLDSGLHPLDISKELGISRSQVYKIKARGCA